MRLLITGAWPDAEKHIPLLKLSGNEIAYMRQETDPLPCNPEWVEGVICNGLFLTYPITAFPHLRYIQLTSVGYDRVPMEAVHAAGIKIHNAHGVYSIPMAEFAIAGILSFYKGFAVFRDQQDKHIWAKNRSLLELFGKKVVIVGCGDVGRECAKRLRSFGAVLTGVNRTVENMEGFDRVVELQALDEELETADIVIISIAFTQETVGLVKAKKLKPDAILVNIARGQIVDLADRVCSAVLDVFEEEPLPPDSDLWDAERTVITPHNSFVGDGNNSRLNDLIMLNLREWTRRESLQ